jgi:hypothetical protein
MKEVLEKIADAKEQVADVKINYGEQKAQLHIAGQHSEQILEEQAVKKI